MSINRDALDFMFDIRDSITDIRDFIQGMTYADFSEDRKTINAVIRSHEVMAERVLRMGVAIFVGVYVARYLGPEQFGKLSYAASFAGLFSALAMLRLDGIVVRELVKDESRRNELLGTAFWLKPHRKVIFQDLTPCRISRASRMALQGIPLHLSRT